jgi:hypothetical protein
LWKKKIEYYAAHLIIIIVFCALAWWKIRNFPLLGYLFIVVGSISFYELKKIFSIPKIVYLSLSCLILFLGCALPSLQYYKQQSVVEKLAVLQKEYNKKPAKREQIKEDAKELQEKYAEIDTSWTIRNYYSPYKYLFGLGLIDCNKSAEFIKGNKVEGPYFNNYDIGGYFIFHLFPTYKPFVDNRPEAYSVDFFNEIFHGAEKLSHVCQSMMWSSKSLSIGFLSSR